MLSEEEKQKRPQPIFPSSETNFSSRAAGK
jgi:hypothetical protein